MLALKPYRSTAAGTPDLLPYSALIAPGVVLGKDGSLLAGFFFRGEDAGSASDSRLNYITEQVNSHLIRFRSGWCMWVDAVRVPSPGYPDEMRSHFPDPISKMIDMERREMFEKADALFETEYAILFKYTPPLRSKAKLGEWIHNEKNEDNDPSKNILAEFNKHLQDFQDGLGDLLNMQRMGTFTAIAESEPYESYESDQLANYLHYTITGNFAALRIPSCPMYMDSWLGYEPLVTGKTPKIGDKYIACVAIDGFPSASEPGILSMFENLPIAYRWSSRFIFLDQDEAEASLKRYFKEWKQWIRGFWSQVFNTSNGIINTDAIKMTKQVEEAINDGKSGLITHGHYTPVVVLMSEDRKLLGEQARYVRKLVNGRGFNARIEDWNTLNAWLGSLPGMAYPNVRRPLFHTLNLADLLPLAGIWAGRAENPCSFYPEGSPPLMHTITTGATPFRLSLHYGQIGHTLVFGPTGAGKSLLIAFFAAQALRYISRPRPDGTTAQATITIFDKGNSMYALCKAVGGQHYDIGSDNAEDLALCPLSDIDTDSGLLWAAEWIGICYQLQTETQLNPDQKNEVRRALKRMREKPQGARSLFDFLNTVQKGTVRDALAHYSIDGTMGKLLDGKQDSLNMPNFTVFEIDELMGMGSKNAIPVLLYLFRRFEKGLTGQPAYLILDEAWVMLGNPIFREKVREWLKELRRKNCAVILATQSLSDAVNSGIFPTLIEQCPTKILLPNNEADLHGTADNPGPAEYYAMFGLGEREVEQIRTARYKQDYFFKSPEGRRWFQLGVGPLAMSFVGVSDKDTIRDVKSFEKKYGQDWPLYWLKSRGVDYEKYAVQ